MSNRTNASRKRTDNRPSHDAFVVINRGNRENATWLRCGAAWGHEDGEGFTVQLDAMPVDGSLVLRTRTAAEEKEGQ